MRFAISIPQLYSDGEFDPVAFRNYCAAVSSWATTGDGAAEVSRVAAAGAEIILFTTPSDPGEQAARLAADVIPPVP